MNLKDKSNKKEATKKQELDEFKQALFLLKICYPKILQILEAFAGRQIAIRDQALNYCYTYLTSLVEGTLKAKGLEGLKNEMPELFESLIGGIEDHGMEWEYRSKYAYSFLGKIEKLYILSGSPTFKLPVELETFFIQVNETIEAHKKNRDYQWEKILERTKEQAEDLKKGLSGKTNEVGNQSNDNRLHSIHLVTNSLEPKSVIFLVLDEQFEMPVRCVVNNKNGSPTYIKKLYDIAYSWDVQNKKVSYKKSLADNINNGLFRKKLIKLYMKTNKFKKPTLVQKSEDKTSLVLKNEVPIKTGLIKNLVPLQYQSLYLDKTK